MVNKWLTTDIRRPLRAALPLPPQDLSKPPAVGREKLVWDQQVAV
jgi:hypothetical protein